VATTEHRCDHPRIPLRDALRMRRVVARVGIVGQVTAVILLLYGTAPLAESARGGQRRSRPIPGR